MAFSWPIDQLTAINRALLLNGDNVVNVADDGSDEWFVASTAYDESLAYIMESHSWGYAARVITLQPSPTVPPDTDWDTAYPLPADLIHLIWLKINQDSTDPPGNLVSTQTLYNIMSIDGVGPCIVVNAKGGPPPPAVATTPAQITIKYISNSGALCDPQNGTPTLIRALVAFIRAGLFGGLHEDFAMEQQTKKEAELILQVARTRYDQQKPKRRFWNSRMEASRRVRRPWPPQGNDNWGGSNIPG